MKIFTFPKSLESAFSNIIEYIQEGSSYMNSNKRMNNNNREEFSFIGVFQNH